MPKFIGPYKILKAMNESLNVTLELPQEFKDRKINPTFHTNLVRPYIKTMIYYSQRGTPKYSMTLGMMRTKNGSSKRYYPINGLTITWSSMLNGC